MSHSFDCKNLQNESYDVTLSMKQQKQRNTYEKILV